MAETKRFEPLPEPDVTIVVYDRATGAVRHVHQEVTIEGAEPPSRTAQEQHALELAKERAGARGVQLKALVVSGEDARGGGRLRVDVKKLKLVRSTRGRRA